MALQMRIKLRDTNLFVEQVGSGRPLLLIHGFPFNHGIWGPQIETLSNHANVIAPDLRGHGQSPPTAGPYSMELLADDCAGVLDGLGVDQPVIVCGLSMGGYVSFEFYRRHPKLVAGMILAATRADADSEETKAKRDNAALLTEMHGTGSVIDSMLPIVMAPQTYQDKPELVAQVAGIMANTSPSGMISALMGMKSRSNSIPTLGQIKVPTLILHGADDQIIPVSESETMHAGLPGSHLEIIPDAGHLPNLEQIQLFNQAVEKFLSQLDN
jgi:pimeloyl-ACP methyl ester carboxylesterase